MADFGKLNFQVAFNPTTAFPLDARCYFEGDNALTAAQAAAAIAEDVGSKNTVYHYGMKILVNQNGVYTWYKITTSKTLEEEGQTPYIKNGYWYIGNVNTNVKAQGDDGKTPVKGTDYYTDAEKAEMVSAVIAALPVYDGEAVTV